MIDMISTGREVLSRRSYRQFGQVSVEPFRHSSGKLPE